MRDFPESEAVLKKLFPHPDYVTARTKWLLRAGLPRVGEAAAADGQLVYAAEPAPGVEMKRTQGRPSVEEALSSWYETWAVWKRKIWVWSGTGTDGKSHGV